MILLGLLVRSERALTQPLWVDEAESTINALTILDHGVPTDSYLGNPIFENTLIKPWPGHPEYEFKDISYSDKGVAIYHGWLPLFSIAASLASFGIGPDHAHGEIRFGRGVDEMRYRTFVPRVPSIVFSAFMLLFVYWAGREMFGNTAACAALLAAALADNFVWLGCQARYYSATLAVVAACVYLIHRIMRRGAWRDFIALGIALSVLFHTHLLSFAIASTATAAMIPFWIGKRRIVFKASLTGAIVAIAALPWLLATGYLRHLGEIPGAWPLLVFPDDFLRYLRGREDYAFLFLIVLCAVGAYFLRPRKLPRIVRESIAHHRPAIILSLVWIVTGFVFWVRLMPAASFFVNRLSLPILVPGLLLVSVVFAYAARLVYRRGRVLLAPALFALFLLVSGRLWYVSPVHEFTVPGDYAPVALLKDLELKQGTKLYVTPSDQLVLSYYTGLPFQSIAPVRRSYLESCPRPIVLVERVHRWCETDDPLGWQGLQEAALRAGVVLDEKDARALAHRLITRIDREDEVARVARLVPPLEEIPSWVAEAVAEQRRLEKFEYAEMHRQRTLPIVLGAYTLGSWSDWWPIFFYRFVDPESRMGDRLNYAGRLGEATAYIDYSARWKVFVFENDTVCLSD